MRSVAGALLAAGALVAGTAGTARAAVTLSVAVLPATAGTAQAPAPVALSVRASLTGDARGSLPPTLRRLSLGLPAGFSTTLADVPACARETLALRGPGACPAGARLGAGSASFVYVAGVVRVAASTEELTLVRGDGAPDSVLLYLRVTRPTPLTFVLPGRLTAAAIAVDLDEVADPPSGYAVVRSLALDVARGVVAGPCPAGAWTFRAHLQFTTGAAEDREAAAACDGTGAAPDVTAPGLRVASASAAVAAGARIAVRLSEAARVHVTLERRSAAGEWRRVRRTAVLRPPGAGVVRLRRGADGRRLAPGRYRVRVRAIDAGGLLSRKRSAYFRLR